MKYVVFFRGSNIRDTRDFLKGMEQICMVTDQKPTVEELPTLLAGGADLVVLDLEKQIIYDLGETPKIITV